MDIGDPSEIPATRRRLPSMRELGAFDIDTPSSARPPRTGSMAEGLDASETLVLPLPESPTAEVEDVPAVALATTSEDPPSPIDANPAAATVAPTSAQTTTPSAPRPSPTAEQLRMALAKADPATRRKLMRLFAGGQLVQQVGSATPVNDSPQRNLVMQREPPAGTAKTTASPHTAARHTDTPSRDRDNRVKGGREPLLQIDENTELLDAAAPLLNAEQRKAGMQAQLDAAIHRDSPRPEPAAHKVLFSAYDPAQHGENVSSVDGRRNDAPVEGHFPAPRQPFQATYKHADGRPMTPEENSVEQELQAQRCDDTLSVLARDGVNGLLLSPRDLDAAVASGLLPAETAATLWNTWAALRPVIHVIEDEPRQSTLPSMAELLAHTDPPDAAEHPQLTQTPAKPAIENYPASHPTATDPPLQTVTQPAPAIAATIAAATAAGTPLSTPRLRLLALLRTLLWLFVVFCVLTTTARLAMWAWLRWGHPWAGA